MLFKQVRFKPLICIPSIYYNTNILVSGSAVEPARLRFDFTYGKPVSSKQLQQIEDWINGVALTDAKTKTRHFPLQKAIDAGAIAVFSEKYSDLVRVVEVSDHKVNVLASSC
jgi:alanyl-tRNA synthetase